MLISHSNETVEGAAAALRAYLLGTVPFDDALLLQRRLHYDVTGDRDQAGLILCEHPPLVTVGRQGSRTHLWSDVVDRGWPVRWIARGGGCWLHLPGQIALYPILPLDRLGLTVPQYLAKLTRTIAAALGDFSIRGAISADGAGVWVGDRLIAPIGVAVRQSVTSFGACLNLNPQLDQFRGIRCHPAADLPMTSLERERRGPVSPSLVRERLLDHFREAFGFDRLSIFSTHPILAKTANARPIRSIRAT